MAKCDDCGNEYYLSSDVITVDARDTFNSFEFAIKMLAPVCDHCGARLIAVSVARATRSSPQCQCSRFISIAPGKSYPGLGENGWRRPRKNCATYMESHGERVPDFSRQKVIQTIRRNVDMAKYGKKASEKVEEAMHERKKGTL